MTIMNCSNMRTSVCAKIISFYIWSCHYQPSKSTMTAVDLLVCTLVIYSQFWLTTIAYSKKAFEMCGNQANWPRQAESILNSLTWLYQRHYRHHQAPAPYTDLVPGSIDNPLRELSERVYRRCSSKHCHVIESKHRRFDQECVKCRVTIYCSERCQSMHYPAHQHLCTFLARWTLNQPMALVTSTTVGDSSCDVKRKRAPLLTLNHYPMKLRSANKRRSSQPTIQT